MLKQASCAVERQLNWRIDPFRTKNTPADQGRFKDAISTIPVGGRMLYDWYFRYELHRRSMMTVRRFLADETAATAIEYCLIASAIALGIFVSIAGIEAKINAKFTAIESSLK
jgi:pilus assembly protein Flp/PilA